MAVGFQPSILESDLALTADYSFIKGPVAEMTLDEIEHRRDRIIPQLKCRCEGLLEVHDMHNRHWGDRYLVSAGDEMAPSNSGSHEVGSAKSSSHGICREDQLRSHTGGVPGGSVASMGASS